VSLVVDEHRLLVSDEIRLSAFRRAIHEVVRPGAVVLDLASGTGILGLLACEAGAGRVYSIEVGGMIEVARALAAANGFAERTTFIRGLSSEVALPEPVDVVVCDQIGHFGVEAGLVQYGSDARDRFLKPAGTMIPARVELWLAPVTSAELYDRVEFWAQRPAGLDFTPARRWAVNTGYPATLAPDDLLGAPVPTVCLDMTRVTPESLALTARTSVERAGILHGVGGWFSALLSPHVTVSNSPLARPRLNRRNVFFPIETPVPVATGDVIDVRMQILPADSLISWTVEVWSRTDGERRRKMRARHSTLAGMLLSREELRRMDPRSAPALTDRGVARLSVLTQCNGVRSLDEIEQAVYDRHSDLFRSRGDASAFVAEVVTRYAR